MRKKFIHGLGSPKQSGEGKAGNTYEDCSIENVFDEFLAFEFVLAFFECSQVFELSMFQNGILSRGVL